SGETDLDKRMLLSVGPLRLDPGDKQTLTYAYTWSTLSEFPCPDLTDFILETDQVQDFFDNTPTGTHSRQHAPIDFQIYPNPASTEIAVQPAATVNTQGATLHIRDLQGRELERHPYQPELSVSHLPNGLYLVECRLQNGQRSINKLLIAR
ncbi:MAG: T9SS type A sorting domain-containing protein, partial [Phaeodactylibacter sp.]|nr:T9SS type A sorting domain-containing protein [Phaeodactylibacter sp.]